MARLQSSGTLSVSQINTLKSLGTTPTSLDQRELQYMGGGGSSANASSAGVCMPNQAEMNNNPRPAGTAAVSWSYTGPGVRWRPTRFSEFYAAYNNLPTLAGTVIFTGDNAGNAGQIRITCSGSDAGAPYTIYFGGTWYVTDGSAQAVFNVARGNNTFYVRDSQNCGTNLEIGRTISYP